MFVYLHQPLIESPGTSDTVVALHHSLWDEYELEVVEETFENEQPFEQDESVGTVQATGGMPPYVQWESLWQRRIL